MKAQEDMEVMVRLLTKTILDPLVQHHKHHRRHPGQPAEVRQKLLQKRKQRKISLPDIRQGKRK